MQVPTRFLHTILFIVVVFGTSCNEYEDVDLPPSKTMFFPAGNTAVFQNVETGEEVSFSPRNLGCSQTGTSEVWVSSHKYKRYHTHQCEQRNLSTNTSAGVLGNSIKSSTAYGGNSWEFRLANSVFTLDEYRHSEENLPHHYIWSYSQNDVVYSQVAVLVNKSGYTGDEGFDTIYVAPNQGIIKLVTSTGIHWERH